MSTRLNEQLGQSGTPHALDGVEAVVTKALPGPGQQASGVLELGALIEAEVDVVAVQRQVGVVLAELARFRRRTR